MQNDDNLFMSMAFVLVNQFTCIAWESTHVWNI